MAPGHKNWFKNEKVTRLDLVNSFKIADQVRKLKNEKRKFWGTLSAGTMDSFKDIVHLSKEGLFGKR